MSNQPGKIVRKRTAAEMEQRSAPIAGGYPPPHQRVITRHNEAVSVSPIDSSLSPLHLFNSSNTTATLALERPSDAGPGQGSDLPLVCGFSGLPLFPPVERRTSLPATPLGGALSVVVPVEEEDPTWMDSIIKELIQSSNSISIPQLIQNVRDIIYPCNPNLGSAIEFRLRSLAADPLIAPPPLPPFHYQQHHPNQQIALPRISSTNNNNPLGVYGNKGSGYFNLGPGQGQGPINIDPASLSFPPDSTACWGVTSPPSSAAAAAGGSGGSSGNSNPNPSSNPSPNPNPKPQDVQVPTPQQQQQPQIAVDQEQESDPATAEVSPPSPRAAPPPPPAAVKAREREEMRQRKRDEDGLHLLTLLLQCAEAVSADKYEEANKMLLEISEWATPFGTSAQRVAAYFSEAMSARLVSSCLGIYAALPTVPHYVKLLSAFQVFNGISPFVKFSHFTANQAIQEAFQREDRVHIVDLDIMQGLQWPGLFHILASRPGGPPFVRLTGLGTSMEALEATGKRLSDFAEKLGLPFEFIPVAEKIGNLDLERLHVSKREALAVHWLQHSLYDVTGSDTNTLGLLQR